MIVVDASVLTALLVATEAHHAEALAWLRQALARQEALVCPTIAPAELASAVWRRTREPARAQAAVRLVRDVSGLSLVAIDGSLGLRAADLVAQHGLRGCDAVYVALAEDIGAPLISLDAAQIEGAAGVVEVGRPAATKA